MIELAYPWCLILLLLPLPLTLLADFRQRSDAVRAPFFERLQASTDEPARKAAKVLTPSRWQKILMYFSWIMLVIAASKPELLGQPVNQQKSARDLMIAVDLSGSMANQDFTFSDQQGSTDRLFAVKRVLKDFAVNREGDRLGLIVFGDAPYLQVPFTEDHDVWLALLNETEVGMAGESTVIGDTIGLAIKLFEQSEVENRVLVILTDGNDTGSKVPPIDAAKISSSYNIKIYCIAIGDPESIGEHAIDSDTLERVAELTYGEYFQALDPQALVGVQKKIAALEPELFETLSFQPRTTLHYIPVALSVFTYLVYFSIVIIYGRIHLFKTMTKTLSARLGR